MKRLLARLLVLAICSVMSACQTLPAVPVRDSNESSQEEQELIRQGIELHELGNYALAEKRYRQILQSNADNAFAMYELAFALVAQGKTREAMSWADKALGYRSSSRPELMVLKANILDGEGNVNAALELYQQGIAEFPDYSSLYYNMGISLANNNAVDQALPVLKKNLQLRPDHAGGHLALGMAFVNLNRKTEAILALTRFLSLEPNSDRSGPVLDELRKLLSRGVSTTTDAEGKLHVGVGPGAMGGSVSDLMIALTSAALAGKSGESAQHSQLAMVVFLLSNGDKPVIQDAMLQSHYLAFLTGLKERKLDEAFIYYIEQARSESARKWLDEHAPEKGLLEVYSRQHFELLERKVSS